MRMLVLAAALLLTLTHAQTTLDLTATLETLRAKYNLPSISGVAILGDEVAGVAAVGKLQAGGSEAVTLTSAYQLGSNSKSMNATMIARLVERGLLRWDSTLGEVLPTINMRDEYKAVTLEQLLTHRSGIVANTAMLGGATRETARVAYLESALAQPRGPQSFLYSNVGYVASAMMAEAVTGKAWDALMRTELLEPLGMVGCGVGFGAAGDPLPHRFQGNEVKVLPMNSGNSRIFDGADQMRCPLTAFARYVSAHLTGERGGSSLLKAETWKRLHSDVAGQGYALGWVVGTRPWARGVVLFHNGTNTNNYAVMWLAPERGIAVVIATNVGADENNSVARVAGITDQAVGALLQELFKLAP